MIVSVDISLLTPGTSPLGDREEARTHTPPEGSRWPLRGSRIDRWVPRSCPLGHPRQWSVGTHLGNAAVLPGPAGSPPEGASTQAPYRTRTSLPSILQLVVSRAQHSYQSKFEKADEVGELDREPADPPIHLILLRLSERCFMEDDTTGSPLAPHALESAAATALHRFSLSALPGHQGVARAGVPASDR